VESLHDQIGDAIEAALEDIAEDGGVTFWDHPDKVEQVEEFDEVMLDASFEKPQYFIRAGDETHAEEASEKTVRATMEVFIFLARRLGTSSTETRHRYVSRMVRDVLAALLVDVHLGERDGGGEYLVENVFAEPAIVDREREYAGWAVAEIRLVTAYTYSGTP
jgi:hypothetical protein